MICPRHSIHSFYKIRFVKNDEKEKKKKKKEDKNDRNLQSSIRSRHIFWCMGHNYEFIINQKKKDQNL